MTLDDVFCFDCAFARAAWDVDCIKHTPGHLRGGREMRIREVLRPSMQRRGRA